MRTVYKDTETGEFVSEETYLRSRAHGGDRYEAVEVDEADVPTVVIKDLFDFDPDDYEGYEFEEREYTGSGSYGEDE